MNINDLPAEHRPDLAKALILGIIPLQDYLLTKSACKNLNELWRFTIGDLKKYLSSLMQDVDEVL